jgi:hypothetical protein
MNLYGLDEAKQNLLALKTFQGEFSISDFIEQLSQNQAQDSEQGK